METAPNRSNITLLQLNDEKVQVRIPAMVLTVLLMALGIAGNTVTFYIYSFRMKWLSTSVFVIALSVYDILSCCVAMPTDLVDLRYPYMFPSMMACKILRFFTYYTTSASTGILLITAIDRHRRVCRPLASQLSVANAKKATLAFSSISLVVAAPVYVLAGKKTHQTRIPHIQGTDCSISDDVRNLIFLRLYFGSLLLIILAMFVTMTVCYILLWCRVRRRLLEPVAYSTPKSKSEALMRRTNLMVFLVTIFFILSFLPCIFIQVARLTLKFEDYMSPIAEATYCVGIRSYFLSNSINPVIYACCNKQFQGEIRRLIGCGRNQVSDHTSSKSSTGTELTQLHLGLHTDTLTKGSDKKEPDVSL